MFGLCNLCTCNICQMLVSRRVGYCTSFMCRQCDVRWGAYNVAQYHCPAAAKVWDTCNHIMKVNRNFQMFRKQLQDAHETRLCVCLVSRLAQDASASSTFFCSSDMAVALRDPRSLCRQQQAWSLRVPLRAMPARFCFQASQNFHAAQRRPQME